MEYTNYLEQVKDLAKNEGHIPEYVRYNLVQEHRRLLTVPKAKEYKTTPHYGYMHEVDNVSPDYSLKRAFREKILNTQPVNNSNSSVRNNDDDDDTLGRVASAAIGFGIGAAVSSLFGSDNSSGSNFGGGDSGGGGASGEW
jgi:uncharacterized membrane protein YgcG